MKTCSKCKQEKPYSDYHKHNQTKDGYKSRCKKCNRLEATDYRNANIGEVRGKDRLRPARPRDHVLSYVKHREYNLARGKIYREENREAVRLRLRQYKSANPGKVNADTANRRAVKLQATPLWSDKQVVKDMYIEANHMQLEVDHIIPLRSKTVCGLHWEGNLQLLSSFDNARKGNKYTPWDGA